MKTNRAVKNPIKTHEGAPAVRTSIHQQLRRSVLSCFLWEDEFYEDGVEISHRITNLADQCSIEFVSNLAVEARTKFNLRHAPLLLLLSLIKRGGKQVGETIYKTINRADELAELVSLYWAYNPEKMLTKQMKIGLGRAFGKFNEYQFVKYDRQDAEVKLRDVLFLCRAKPADEEHAELYKRIANKQLATPDTWESRLTGGENKKDVFTDLLTRKKLGYMALLKNLRGMSDAGVDHGLIKKAVLTGDHSKILPYRFIAAARHASWCEPELDQAMQSACGDMEKLSGRTIVLVDTSPSMVHPLSRKSDLTRMDAAFGLAILVRELAENVRIFAFSTECKEVPARRGMALADAIKKTVPSHSTYLGEAVRKVNSVGYDRLIVITDEQSHDPVPSPVSNRAYMLNVASTENSVGYGAWTRIFGFSEACVGYIQEYEKEFD